MAARAGLAAYSWNIQRVDRGLKDVVQHMDDNGPWDFALLQEVASAFGRRSLEEVEEAVGGGLRGHMLYLNPARPWDCAVVAHRRWAQRKLRVLSCPAGVLVQFAADQDRVLNVASIHLPTMRSPLEEYEMALDEVDQMLRAASTGRPRHSCLLGVDANSQLDEERGSLVVEVCRALDLSVCAQEDWTHQSCPRRGRRATATARSAAVQAEIITREAPARHRRPQEVAAPADEAEITTREAQGCLGRQQEAVIPANEAEITTREAKRRRRRQQEANIFVDDAEIITREAPGRHRGEQCPDAAGTEAGAPSSSSAAPALALDRDAATDCLQEEEDTREDHDISQGGSSSPESSVAARRRRGRAKHQAKRRRVVATAAGAARTISHVSAELIMAVPMFPNTNW